MFGGMCTQRDDGDRMQTGPKTERYLNDIRWMLGLMFLLGWFALILILLMLADIRDAHADEETTIPSGVGSARINVERYVYAEAGPKSDLQAQLNRIERMLCALRDFPTVHETGVPGAAVLGPSANVEAFEGCER